MFLDFKYHRPADVADAISLKRKLGGDAIYWAGGTDLVLQIKSGKRHVGHCVDLTALPNLSFIETHARGFRIGALTPLSDLEKHNSNTPHLRTLRDVARLMCTVQTRTIATIGGNLCNASPAADLVAPLIAMSAVLVLEGPKGTRELPMEDFMISPGKPALLDHEMLREIVVQTDRRPVASAYHRVDRTVVDIALVSAASSMTLDDGAKIAAARIALGAVAARVIRSPAAENLLAGCGLDDLDDRFLTDVGAAAASDATPITDVRASAAYRKAMIKVLVSRALQQNIDDLKRSLA